MTPTELEEYARQRYNAVNDTFFSQSEMLRYIYDAQMQLARETDCIRAVYTTTTVASQQEYEFPSRVIKLKRVTYNGQRVDPRSLQEVLDMTGSVASPTGSPLCYAIWDEAIYLAPTPDDAQTLKLFAVLEPDEVTAASVFEVPTRYHLDLAEYCNWQMAIKDKNYSGAALHQQNWQTILAKAKAFERKMLRGDGLAFVRDVDRDIDSWVIPR